MDTPPPQASCINSRLILIEAAVRLEPLYQDLHLLHLSKGQVWDDTQQTLEHTRVGANKGAVDLVQEHHQLILVTREEEVALQQKRMEVRMVAIVKNRPQSQPLSPDRTVLFFCTC